MLFSLLSSRPLKAALLGAAATSASISCLIAVTGDYRLLHTPAAYVEVVPLRWAVIGLLVLVDAVLACAGCGRPAKQTAGTDGRCCSGCGRGATRYP